MLIDKLEIDSTTIKFYDDSIEDEKIEVVKKEIDIAFQNAIQNTIDKEL